MDDDPVDDWKQEAKTVSDPALAETVPHRSLDYLAGREDGYSEGVNRVIAALEWELVLGDLDQAERAPILGRIRQRALRRG